MNRLLFLCLAAFASILPSAAQTGPETLVPGLQVRPAGATAANAVRLVHEPECGCFYIVTANGDVHRRTLGDPNGATVHLYSESDHGLGAQVLGMAVGPDGTLYVVGNRADSVLTQGILMRGISTEGEAHRWETVARTEPYPRSNTPFDHTLNGIVVSPDGGSLFVNSGSRTDHGEIQDAGGSFPGLREVPLTSAILRVPADADSLILPNDAALLAAGGFLFADGTRNSFDLAFDAEGRLFATENAGDRDDSEELNWIREGRHYGFPWRMGTDENPQQYSDYDPESDLLLNPASFAVQSGFFYNDPTFPPQPEGLVFADPIINTGPDATLYRDPADGAIRMADALGTFTTHRSPLGLVFDVNRTLPDPYTGDAFVLSWTGQESDLLAPFTDEGEDLLHLTLEQTNDAFELSAHRLARGFTNPIDAVFVGRSLYILEFDDAGTLWELRFDSDTAADDERPELPVALEVFPRPAADHLEIRLDVDRTQYVQVEIFSLDGRRVAAIDLGLLAGGGAHTFRHDISRLPAGVYFLRAAGEAFSTVQPIVKLR